MARSEAMLWEDYMKLRHAKVGEVVTLSTGEEITKAISTDDAIDIHRSKPSKWSNLDTYDGTYV